MTPATFRVCGECLHAFETADDLELADYELRMEWHLKYGDVAPVRSPAALIFACPECSHDF